jgi:hypothetical protein
LNSKIQKSQFYSLQVDESTDITKDAELLAYIRYADGTRFQEEMLFCQKLSDHVTGESVFKKIDSFFREHDIRWENCASVCTDGCPSMMGKNDGLKARIKNVAPQAKYTHCMIHRQALAARSMTPALTMVMEEAVKIINFIKARALNSRLFREMCADMGALYKNLLLYTAVRWLSRGKCLNRLFNLKHEVLSFLMEQNHELADRVCDLLWLCRLAYLADIFGKINELNLTLQGGADPHQSICPTSIFRVHDKVEQFKAELQLIIDEINNKNFTLLPVFSEFLRENDFIETNDKTRQVVLTEDGNQFMCAHKEIIVTMKTHLAGLIKSFEDYFPPSSEIKQEDWIRNPFKVELNSLPIHLDVYEKLELIGLKNDRAGEFGRVLAIKKSTISFAS